MEPSALPTQLRDCRPAHLDLEGLVIVGPSGDEHRTIESAAASSQFSMEELYDAIVSFYRETLGVKMEEQTRTRAGPERIPS